MIKCFKFSHFPYDCIIKDNSAVLKDYVSGWNITELHSEKPHIILSRNASIITFELPNEHLAFTCDRHDARRRILLFRFCIEFIAMRNNTVFFHASAVDHEGKAMLFLGNSGNGKSTISRLLAPDEIINDDVTVVAVTKDNTPFVHRSSLEKKNPYSKEMLPLSALFGLKQGMKEFITQLSLKEKLYLLMDNNLLFLYLNNPVKTAFLSQKIRTEASTIILKHLYNVVDTVSISSITFSLSLNVKKFSQIIQYVQK